MKRITISSSTIAILLATILIVDSSPLRADDLTGKTASTCTWVRIGLGGRLTSGLAFEAGIMQSRGKNLFTLSGTASNDAETFSTHREEDWTVGLLYGRAWAAKFGIASLSAGAGVAGGSRNFGREDFGPIIAILGEAQLTFRPASFFGLSLHANTTLHTKASFVSIMLSVNLGKLK